LPEVSDLAIGAPVRVDGVEVGNVESIKLVPRTAGHIPEKNKNIEVVDAYRPEIPKRHFDGFGGEPADGRIARQSSGEYNARFHRDALKEGQEIAGVEEKAIKQVVERSADVLANLQALLIPRKTARGVQEGRGTLGKLLTDDQAYKNLNSILTKTNQVVSNIQAGRERWGSWWRLTSCTAK